MFHARNDAIRRGHVCALESAHVRGGVEAAEPRVLAKALGDAAPARVAAEIHHRREGPVIAAGGGFARGNPLGAFEEFRFPRARLRERDGENGAETVDRIVSENQRNTETRPLDSDVLKFIAYNGRFDVLAAAEK